MPVTRTDGVALRGLVAAVPAHREGVAELGRRFGPDQAARIAAATGIHTRHLAAPGQCLSDLALPAARLLLERLGWDADSVGLLCVVTQTPDHVLPATACLLQERLGLGRACAAFDLGLGCSGFIYGLWTVAGLLATLPAGGRALLVVGDTTSRLLDPEDRSVAPLFGDAAAIIALERDSTAPPWHFDLGSDGAGAPYLRVEAGGMRPGSGRPLFMDGTQVFAFTLRQVPGSIQSALNAAGWTVAGLDHLVLHQANEMMIRRLGQKLGATAEQLVIALAERGNTSSASIPLALADRLGPALEAGSKRLLLSGFGVGWSWGSLAAEIGPLAVCRTLIVPD